MNRRCCDGACHQGRTCPLTTERFATRTSLPERLLRDLYYLFERSWVAVGCFYAVVLVFAIAINYPVLQ